MFNEMIYDMQMKKFSFKKRKRVNSKDILKSVKLQLLFLKALFCQTLFTEV